MIDSTFATPYNQNPLDFGIDLVMHSATKYLGGHNDLLAGVVVGNANMIAALREAQGHARRHYRPNTAYLLLRGIKTFALRMQRHNANGWLRHAFWKGRGACGGSTIQGWRAILRRPLRGGKCVGLAGWSASKSTAACR